MTIARRVLVLGGARSGKSYLAETMLADEPAVDYVATGMLPTADDPEWQARVAIHQQRRPANWRTIETRDLEPILHSPEHQAVLIDCISTWLSGVMDDCSLWLNPSGPPGVANPSGISRPEQELAARLDGLVAAWTRSERLVVAVSNEVGSGVVPETASGRRYRDELGRLNAQLAAGADEVWLVTAGIGQRLK